MKRLLLIMNPCAGTRRANRFLPGIISTFTKYGYECTVYMTASSGDGVSIAKARGGEADLVVAIGGDGTFNEVVTGLLLGGHTTEVGYIPAGSTNDFAASLQLPGNILQAAECIMTGQPHTYDVGKFQDRYFTYVASFGAFTRASYETPQSVKNALGHLAYILQGIWDLGSISPIHVKLDTDRGTWEDDYIFGAVSNSTSIAGVLTLDRALVNMNDGVFEVLLVRTPKDMIQINELIRALTAQDYSSPMLHLTTASRLEIASDPMVPWTLDGERADGAETIVIENIRSAIRLRHEPCAP